MGASAGGGGVGGEQAAVRGRGGVAVNSTPQDGPLTAGVDRPPPPPQRVKPEGVFGSGREADARVNPSQGRPSAPMPRPTLFVALTPASSSV